MNKRHIWGIFRYLTPIIKNEPKRPMCKHEWEALSFERCGATLSWTAQAVPEYLKTEKCSKCDAIKESKGWIVPGEKPVKPPFEVTS
jgi:hypothetical protein